MESELLVILAGGSIALITEGIKRFTSIDVNSLVIVAVISLLGGGAYAYLVSKGLWESVREQSTLIFGSAVTIYNVVKALLPSTK